MTKMIRVFVLTENMSQAYEVTCWYKPAENAGTNK